jgi:hypothetical protein
MQENAEPSAAADRLFGLLEHYYGRAGDDRTKWVDRLTELPDGAAAELTRLHGALLAAAWIELNVGTAKTDGAGRVAECYRLTPAGRQALKRR